MKLLSLAVIALTLVLTGCNSERQRRIDEAQAAVDRDTAQMRLETAELDASTFKLTAQLVQMHFGREAADLWVKCKATPPKAPANQKACKAIQDRFDKWSKAEHAKDAAAAAKW